MKFYLLTCVVFLVSCGLKPVYRESSEENPPLTLSLELEQDDDNAHIFAWEMDRLLNIHDNAPHHLTARFDIAEEPLFIQGDTSARMSEVTVTAHIVLYREASLILKRTLFEHGSYVYGSSSYADAGSFERMRHAILRRLAERISLELLTFFDNAN